MSHFSRICMFVSTGIAHAIWHFEGVCLITYVVVVCENLFVFLNAACRTSYHAELAGAGFCLHIFSVTVLVRTLMINPMRLVLGQARLFWHKPLFCATTCWPDWKPVVAHRTSGCRILAQDQGTKCGKHCPFGNGCVCKQTLFVQNKLTLLHCDQMFLQDVVTWVHTTWFFA